MPFLLILVKKYLNLGKKVFNLGILRVIYLKLKCKYNI